MKPQVLEQFRQIKITLVNNVDTIGKLISQAQILQTLAEKIPGTGQADLNSKERLQEAIKEMQDSIAVLIDQTKHLLESYDKFSEGLFHDK